MKSALCLLIALSPALGFGAENAMDQQTQVVVKAYAQRGYDIYSRAYQGALNIQKAVGELIANPSQKTLDTARKVWLTERDPYSITEVYRFYGGPIDGNDGPEEAINSWPLDEGYIDYVLGNDKSGIINRPDLYPTIDEDLLRGLNLKDGDKNIATGYHAIEFLLWGQDFNPNGPGNRPYTDYVVGQGKNADRRGQYLNLVADILVKDLQKVVKGWDLSDPASYGSNFIKPANAQASLGAILSGVYHLAAEELSQERIYTAYDSQQQEDEHSCFSDNTNNDIISDYKGMVDVLEYKEAGGLSILDLLAEKSPSDAQKIQDAFKGLDALMAIFPTPFDQAILIPKDRVILLNIVHGLQDLGTIDQSAASDLGVSIQ